MPRRASFAVFAALAFAAGCGGSSAAWATGLRAPAAPAATGVATVEARPGRDIRWRGATFRLVAIEVEGNEHAPVADLLAMMMLAHETAIDEAVLQRDELWIAAYYFDRGYLMAHVEPIVLTRSELGDELRAHVVVREGPVIRVRSLDAYEQLPSGARAPLSVDWARPALEGRPFARGVFATALEALRRRYRDRGQAEVDTNLVDAIDVTSRTVTLDVGVVPGAYFKLGAIRVTGNRAVSSEAILDELAIREGDLYSETALELAVARLQNLPWLSRACASTRRGQAENTIDVHFEIEERAGLAPRMAAR